MSLVTTQTAAHTRIDRVLRLDLGVTAPATLHGRAARIVDQLHDAGILGPPDGSKPREVLIGLDGLELLISGRDADDPMPF